VVEINIQQQSKPMELFGLGVMDPMEDLELMIQLKEILQSPHLLVGLIGNK
jgi:hypothetical protein